MRKFVVRGACAIAAIAFVVSPALIACSSTEGDRSASFDGGDAGPLDSGAADDASADGAVVDAAGEPEDGDFVVPDASVACATTPCMTKLAGSADGFCAVTNDGQVFCWGANRNGQLGEGPMRLSSPTRVNGITGVTNLGMSQRNTCARVSDGGVYCWGQSDLLRAGMAPDTQEELPFGNIRTPTRLDAVPPADRISVGDRFACVTNAGELTCWGTNDARELGRGATAPWEMAPPGKATLLTHHASEVVAGTERTFVITTEGAVASWGANRMWGTDNFLIGRDSSEDPNAQPMLIPGLARVRSIGTSFWHSCAVVGRFVECWGANLSGQLGRGTFDRLDYLPGRSMLDDVAKAEAPDASAGEHDVPVQVVTGLVHTCAVLGSGRVYCWGRAGIYGLLGPDVDDDLAVGRPTRIDGFGGPVVALAAANNSMCALLRSGAVECWGDNGQGQVGTGMTDTDPHPVPVRLTFPQ